MQSICRLLSTTRTSQPRPLQDHPTFRAVLLGLHASPFKLKIPLGRSSRSFLLLRGLLHPELVPGRLNLQRASRRLQTNGVWWKRTTSKKGRRRQLPSALHWERNARQRNKLHPKATTTKAKHGLALYVASLFQTENRGENGSSVRCASKRPTSSEHQATRAVHTRLHEQCTPGYTSSAHQATRAVHTRLHEQCTPGYTSSAHQATRAVHTRLHEQCTPGYNRLICPNCESDED
ncbi:hypothetical protein LSAT2_026317 [Lamellibrachia satsuma]|nr:hypothetical protein LSAT2_026317 [Lamellibrachia satsuma]